MRGSQRHLHLHLPATDHPGHGGGHHAEPGGERLTRRCCRCGINPLTAGAAYIRVFIFY